MSAPPTASTELDWRAIVARFDSTDRELLLQLLGWTRDCIKTSPQAADVLLSVDILQHLIRMLQATTTHDTMADSVLQTITALAYLHSQHKHAQQHQVALVETTKAVLRLLLQGIVPAPCSWHAVHALSNLSNQNGGAMQAIAPHLDALWRYSLDALQGESGCNDTTRHQLLGMWHIWNTANPEAECVRTFLLTHERIGELLKWFISSTREDTTDAIMFELLCALCTDKNKGAALLVTHGIVRDVLAPAVHRAAQQPFTPSRVMPQSILFKLIARVTRQHPTCCAELIPHGSIVKSMAMIISTNLTECRRAIPSASGARSSQSAARFAQTAVSHLLNAFVTIVTRPTVQPCDHAAVDADMRQLAVHLLADLALQLKSPQAPPRRHDRWSLVTLSYMFTIGNGTAELLRSAEHKTAFWDTLLRLLHMVGVGPDEQLTALAEAFSVLRRVPVKLYVTAPDVLRQQTLYVNLIKTIEAPLQLCCKGAKSNDKETTAQLYRKIDHMRSECLLTVCHLMERFRNVEPNSADAGYQITKRLFSWVDESFQMQAGTLIFKLAYRILAQMYRHNAQVLAQLHVEMNQNHLPAVQYYVPRVERELAAARSGV